MPNSAARRTGGAERWAPPAAQLRRARRRQDRSRHPCPPPGLPAPGSQEPRHGCLLLDADRWGKPRFCLALKTWVPKAALLPAGRGWSWVWSASQGTAPSLPDPFLGSALPGAALQPQAVRTSSVCFSLGTLIIPKPILESGGKGWLLDEDEWLKRLTVIESGLEETSLFGFVVLVFGLFQRVFF